MAKSISTVKNVAERMTAAKLSDNWIGMAKEEQIVYLGGKPYSAWRGGQPSFPDRVAQRHHLYRGPKVSRIC